MYKHNNYSPQPSIKAEEIYRLTKHLLTAGTVSEYKINFACMIGIYIYILNTNITDLCV